MPFAPLLNSRIDKVLIRTASDLNQQLFEFVKATGICLVTRSRMVAYGLRRQWLKSGLFGGQVR